EPRDRHQRAAHDDGHAGRSASRHRRPGRDRHGRRPRDLGRSARLGVPGVSAVSAAGEHDVWARVAWGAVDLSGELGVPPDRLLVGLPYDAAELRRRTRMPWADYCRICENVGNVAGGMAELEDLLASAYHQVNPELRSIAGSLVSPRTFLRFVMDVLDPLMF